MKIIEGLPKDEVAKIRKAIKENDGYCPCSVFKTDATECMCKEFRDKLNDQEWFGSCHCGLYKKIKE